MRIQVPPKEDFAVTQPGGVAQGRESVAAAINRQRARTHWQGQKFTRFSVTITDSTGSRSKQNAAAGDSDVPGPCEQGHSGVQHPEPDQLVWMHESVPCREAGGGRPRCGLAQQGIRFRRDFRQVFTTGRYFGERHRTQGLRQLFDHPPVVFNELGRRPRAG